MATWLCPGPRFWTVKAGDVARQILDRGRAGTLDVRFALRVDGEGHVLDRRGPLRGRDDDLRIAFGFLGATTLRSAARLGERWRCGEERGNRGSGKKMMAHETVPLFVAASVRQALIWSKLPRT
jgi:hypothetical protein